MNPKEHLKFSPPCTFPSQGKSLAKPGAGLGRSLPFHLLPGLLHLKPLALHSGNLPFEFPLVRSTEDLRRKEEGRLGVQTHPSFKVWLHLFQLRDLGTVHLKELLFLPGLPWWRSG